VKERVQESQRMADLRRAEVAEDVMLKAGQRGASWVLIPSPDSTIEWRIMNRLSVERSTDGGATWTRSTGAESPLNAGSSPSPAVCWVVGARGSVLVTTDSGRTWQRVPFPEQSNLVRVIATSADAAAVTAENGRTFTTSDRGGSWK
jgi:hypothetical protein